MTPAETMVAYEFMNLGDVEDDHRGNVRISIQAKLKIEPSEGHTCGLGQHRLVTASPALPANFSSPRRPAQHDR